MPPYNRNNREPRPCGPIWNPHACTEWCVTTRWIQRPQSCTRRYDVALWFCPSSTHPCNTMRCDTVGRPTTNAHHHHGTLWPGGSTCRPLMYRMVSDGSVGPPSARVCVRMVSGGSVGRVGTTPMYRTRRCGEVGESPARSISNRTVLARWADQRPNNPTARWALTTHASP